MFAALREGRRCALMPFLMAGDPSLETCTTFLERFAEAGADVLEIGVPFSDPIADGPVNQRAAQRALDRGVTLAAILDMVANLRSRLPHPIVLLTYYNPVLQCGLETFCRRTSLAGADGLVIPDLPPEEGESLRTAADPIGLDIIAMAAPTGTDARLAQVAAASRGFIYCVSLTGVTGVRANLAADATALVRRLRRHTSLPLCVGFGVSTPEHAREIAAVADGVIVGSAIVSLIEREGASAGPMLTEFVQSLRRGADGAARAAAT
jgi:tryptophan synthase alpha chain